MGGSRGFLGVALLGYTLYRNVIPWRSGAELWGSVLAIGALVVVIIVVLARPRTVRRAGILLTRGAGLAPRAILGRTR